MLTAIPNVKPSVIVLGMNFIKSPSLKAPIAISISPAIIVATVRPDTPYSATMP